MAIIGDTGSTSVSLLKRVREREAAAWDRLCLLYGPVVYSWCRRAGLQHTDAADTIQDVFREIFRSIDGFRGDAATDTQEPRGSFRGWLWVIARNRIRLHFRNQSKLPQAFGGSKAQRRFAEQSDVANFADDEPDAVATRRRIVRRTLELIRGDFNSTTWQVFTRLALQGHSITDVATEFGLTENAVRQAKFRVLRRLRDELEGQF